MTFIILTLILLAITIKFYLNTSKLSSKPNNARYFLNPLYFIQSINDFKLLFIILIIFYRIFLFIISLPLPDCSLNISVSINYMELFNFLSMAQHYTLTELFEYFYSLLQNPMSLGTPDGFCSNTCDLSNSTIPLNHYYIGENPNDNHPVIAKIKSSYNSSTFKLFTVKKGAKCFTFMALEDYKDELDAFIKNPNTSETQKFAAVLIRMQIESAITAKDISVN